MHYEENYVNTMNGERYESLLHAVMSNQSMEDIEPEKQGELVGTLDSVSELISDLFRAGARHCTFKLRTFRLTEYGTKAIVDSMAFDNAALLQRYLMECLKQWHSDWTYILDSNGHEHYVGTATDSTLITEILVEERKYHCVEN